MSKKWVYRFNELDQIEEYVGGSWDDVRGLLGGKGANLAEMVCIGVPLARLAGGELAFDIRIF